MPIDACSAFTAQGFVLWPMAIDPHLRASLVAAVEKIQAQSALLPPELKDLLLFERDLPASRRGGIDGADVGDAIFIIGDPSRLDGAFLDLLRDPALAEAATRLLGGDEAVVHFMNVTIKHSGFGRSIAWHRDYPNEYFCTRESSFIRLMVCLDGMAPESGATCFHAGSHDIPDPEARHQKRNRAWPLPEDAQASTLCCQPGQIVAIHPKVLHGGGMNTSAGMRRNVILQVGRPGAEVVTDNQESLTGTLLKRTGARTPA